MGKDKLLSTFFSEAWPEILGQQGPPRTLAGIHARRIPNIVECTFHHYRLVAAVYLNAKRNVGGVRPAHLTWGMLLITFIWQIWTSLIDSCLLLPWKKSDICIMRIISWTPISLIEKYMLTCILYLLYTSMAFWHSQTDWHKWQQDVNSLRTPNR